MTAAEYAAGLRQLADLIENSPNLPTPTYLKNFSVWSFDDAKQMRDVGFAALRMGAKVEKDYSEELAHLEVTFGPITAKGLAWRADVCERVLVGVETEMVDEPDPDAPLVTIPDPTVTKPVERTVEKYEWRCGPTELALAVGGAE